MVVVIGYILVAVNLSPVGEVGGTAINYYESNYMQILWNCR